MIRLGDAGSPPYTRGVYDQMYRTRPWTMRQYSGFGTAAETNERFHFLLGAGQTGLSCAFDLPTQMGYDSDHPRSEGEVGKVGVAIDSLEDMEILLKGLPLDTVTTSMTINSTAAILLLMYELVAEKQGVPASQIGGTIQNDILKEYVARGTYIYPPRQSMRIITDIFAYCGEHVPRWNTISISGYHIREAGSTAVQEIAFTLSNAIAYVQAAVDAGLDVDDFAPRLSFFWNGHNDFFEEVAKFRAARRMWYSIMSERFGAQNEKSKLLRFHTQTAGSMLTAQQPENNIVRVALQAMAAALGGTQITPHQRVRRGAGTADRARREDRAAHAADRGVRDGHDRNGRPVGGFVLRGVLDRRGRGRSVALHRAHRRRRWRGRGDRGRLHAGRDRAGRVRVGEECGQRREDHRGRQQVCRRGRWASPTCSPSTPSWSVNRPDGCGTSGLDATRPRSTRPSPSYAPRRREPRTCCTR